MLTLWALVPAVASAAITNAPGATEGDQYFEEVPNGGGSSGVNHHGGGAGSGGTGSGTGSASQSVAATQSLDKLGPDGQAAAALANANRPPEQTQSGQNGKNPASPATQTVSPTDGDGGMGVWFPLLIAATAVAAIAYGLRRRLYPA